MIPYAIRLRPEAKAALDLMNTLERDFALGLLDELAWSPSQYSEPADPEFYPGGGMVAKAIMPIFGDSVYFAVVFRFSGDEAALIVSDIFVFAPPQEDEPESA